MLRLTCYASFAGLALTVAPYIGAIDTQDTQIRELVMSIRRSRALLATVAGGGLALAGVLFQSLLRNPLATPFTLGVSSGASLGAVLAISVGGGALVGLLGPMVRMVSSLLGAFSALGLVYLLARTRRGGVATETLLLGGVAVSTFAGALILFCLYSADPSQTAEILKWLMGAISDDPVRGPRWALGIGGFVVAGLLLSMFLARDLNVMVFGDEVAAGRGVSVERLRLAIYLAGGTLTAAVVAGTGPVGFVGLVVPHFCRLLTGPDHRLLSPAACLTGAGYLTLCDALSRTLFYPTELPVGILTAAIGGPVFVALLLRQSRKHT